MLLHRGTALIVGCLVMLAACAPEPPYDGPPARVDTATPPIPTPVTLPPALPSPTPIPPLPADTGPYENMVGLLDGVCFEYLLTLADEPLVWTTQQHFDDFFDVLDEAELCQGAVRPPSFDFGARALAGAIGAIVGCDAAHRVMGLDQNDAARTVTLRIAFEVRPGCDYELLEPVLVAVPQPPAGYALLVAATQGAG